MAVIKIKPTSPGHRGMVKISRDHLYKGEPHAPLLEPQFQKAGRNNNGHITTRHKGGGHKHHYRVVDFVRNKDGIPAKVERIEYDPNRTAHLALVCYADGERRYIIAPRGLEVGSVLLSGSEAPIRAGNTLPVRNIPVGSTIHKARENEELRAFLNAGHRRSGLTFRCESVGNTHTVVSFASFAAVALAGLHDVPDTIATRSVIVRMRRRGPGDVVEPYRLRVHEPRGSGDWRAAGRRPRTPGPAGGPGDARWCDGSARRCVGAADGGR